MNSAGILIHADAANTSDDDWRDTLAINLDAPFFLSRAALPHLTKTEGSIVNISSYWGLQAGEAVVAYCVSKGALNMLTKAMAKDAAADGVRVNAICPGGVDTPMLAAGAESGPIDVERFDPYGGEIPIAAANRKAVRSPQRLSASAAGMGS